MFRLPIRRRFLFFREGRFLSRLSNSVEFPILHPLQDVRSVARDPARQVVGCLAPRKGSDRTFIAISRPSLPARQVVRTTP